MLLSLCISLSAAGAPPAAGLSWRRVLVPEAELASQIRGLLPLKREEFERRLALANLHGNDPAGPAAVRIEEATFRARLAADSLIQGHAQLVIAKAGDQAAFMALEPCNVALRAAQWSGPVEGPALLGADSAGKVQCLVERSGTLALEWAARAASYESGAAVFALQLPPAPRRRLEVVAPADVHLTVDSGLVQAAAATEAEAGHRLWVLDLAGSSDVRLRALPLRPAADSRPLTIVREATTYTVLRSTIDMDTTLTLDVLTRAAQHLQLDCAAQLSVNAVRLGDESVPFAVVTAADSGHTKIEVSLPQPLRGLSHALHVTATAEWPGVGRWNLPRLHLAEGTFQEGQAEIVAPPWLRLTMEPSPGSTPTLISPAASGRTLERFVWQLFEPDSPLSICAEPMVAPLREESGTQITIEANQISGVLVADLTTLDTARFEVEARVPRHWIVDAVETQPADLLADRLVEARGAGPQVLRIRLNRPLAGARPLRLVVRAHYRRPANGQPFGENPFQLATFPEVRDARRLVAVRVSDPAAELRLTGDEHLERVNPGELSPADQQLFESRPGTIVFVAGTTSSRLGATLESTTARYRADATVQATFGLADVRQRIVLACQPEATAVGTVLVRLAPRPVGVISWRLRGDEGRELSAAIEPAAASAPAVNEIAYRLLLPRPQAGPFAIEGQWQSPPDTTAVTLAWLPEATAQAGLVEIYSGDPNLAIDASDVSPLPSPRVADQTSAELRGRYRYAMGRPARLTVAPLHRLAGPRGAWIERLVLTSRFCADGRAEHEAALTVGNAGVSTLLVRLPAGAEDVELAGGSEAFDVETTAARETELRVSLPVAERQCTVVVRYASSSARLGHWPVGTLGAPIPQTDLPVLDRQWVVELPPGLAPHGGFMAAAQLQSRRKDAAIAATQVDALEPRAGSSTDTSLVRKVSRWAKGPALASRWFSGFDVAGDNAALPLSSNASFRAWSTWQAGLPVGSEAQLAVHRPAVLQTWAVCICLLVSIVIWRLAPGGPWLWSLAAMLVAVAALLSVPFVGLVAGGAAGVVWGACLRLLWPPAPRVHVAQAEATAETTLVPRGAPLAGTFLLCLGCAVRLLAASPAPEQAAAAQMTRVIMPVDEDGLPAGEYVYLEPALYEALHRAAASETSSTPAWLLLRSRYELSRVAGGAGNRGPLCEVRAQLELQTFRPGETARLAFRREEVILLANQARLNGEGVSLAWAADDTALCITIPQPGRHRLDLALGTTARVTGQMALLEIATPPAAIASAAISVRDFPSLGLDDAIVQPTGDAGRQEMLLATSRSLAVQWEAAPGAAGALPGLEAEQLLWWKIRPGSVVLQGRFHLRPQPGPVSEALIEVDPRLRLLPGLSAGGAGRVTVEEGPTNIVKVALDSAVAEPTVQLSWLWADATGIGNLVLPRANIRVDRLLRDWTAISIDPALTLTTKAAASEPGAADFLRIWGESTTLPTAVFEPTQAEMLEVLVRPGEPPPSVETTLDWCLAQGLATLRLNAQLTSVPPTRLAHRLTLPSQLRVKRVVVTHAGRPVAQRWTQARDGTLIVTLLESAAAEVSIALAAELPVAKSQVRLALPSLEFQDTRVKASRLRVYRQHDVLVQPLPHREWKNDPAAGLGEWKPDHGRLVTAVHCDAPRPPRPLVVELSPNQPRVAGRMVMRAVEADGDWRGEVNLRLDVSDGVLDEICLDIADRWSEPLEIESPLEQTSEVFTVGSRRLLTIRPRTAVTEHWNITVRGPLSSVSGGLHAPNVTILGHPQVERLVWLDRELGGERIEWQMVGLALAPPELASEVALEWRPARGDLFRLTGPRYDATARFDQFGSGAPRLRLADMRLALKPDRRFLAAAVLTILPGPGGELTFSLPPDCRLIQAVVDERAVPVVGRGLRTWSITALNQWLPYQVTILYDGVVPLSTTAIEVAAPQISGLEPEQIIWSLENGGQGVVAQVAKLPTSAARGTRSETAVHEEADLLRLEAVLEALEAVSSAQGIDIPDVVWAENMARWQLVAEAQQQAVPLQPEKAELTTGQLARLKAARDRAAVLKQRHPLPATMQTREAQPPRPLIGESSHAPEHIWLGGGHDDTALRLVVHWPNVPWASRRGTGAAALVGLAVVAALIGAWPAARLCCGRQTHWLLAIAGLAWWLLAPLGWLGWLAVLASLRSTRGERGT